MATTGFHLPKTAASTQQQNDLSEEREKSRRSVFGAYSETIILLFCLDTF